VRVLYDKRIRAWIQTRAYKTFVRPAMLYGAKTWSIKRHKKRNKKKRNEMLRWMFGLTKYDRIRNETN
jgi:hypothetical protein